MPKVNKREAKREVKIVSEETQAMSITTPHFNVKFAPRRFLVYSRFNDRDWIHIREYNTMGGKSYPSKKGVCFTPARLSSLREKIEVIDKMLTQQEVNASYGIEVEEGFLYRAHLGANIYATVHNKFGGVDLRRHWRPEGPLSFCPTKNGIYLPASQWVALKGKLDQLLAAHTELLDVPECINSHVNETEMLECRECFPPGSLKIGVDML